MKINNDIFKSYKINILLYGDSASSYIIAQNIKKSPKCKKLYIFGKNKIVKNLGIPVDLDGNELVNFALKNNINLFICDSEINANGIISAFRKQGILTLGATKSWARLESSKEFGKIFASNFNIPIPKFEVCKNLGELNQKIKLFNYPLVIKNDGYAKGLGSYIVENAEDVMDALNKISIQNFKTTKSESSFKLIIEQYITGEELSDICIWNGTNLIPLCCIKDYKKISKNSKINTAGMGAYYSKWLIDENKQNLINDYHKKLETALLNLKAKFTGPIYSGLIFSNNQYHLLEYNMRFGTTESAIIFSNLNIDFVDFAINIATSTPFETIPFNENNPLITVALYPNGYPYDIKNTVIPKSIIDKFIQEDISVLFNKTRTQNTNYILEEGSCIYLVCKENKKSILYNIIESEPLFKNIVYRTDIGL